MKQKRKTYAYLNQEFKFVADSAAEAAMKASVATAVVFQILRKQRLCTKQGWHFSDHELTDEEIEQLPIKCNHHQAEVKDARGCYKDQKGYTKVDGKRCRQIVDEQEYEVSGSDCKVTYQASKKQERIDNFKQFLFTSLKERWMLIPKRQATLEKTFIREFLDSI